MISAFRGGFRVLGGSVEVESQNREGESMVKVGDWVKLTGEDWKRYGDVGVGVGRFVQITDIDESRIWAGNAGTVGNLRGLFGPDNSEGSGDYAVELVPDIRVLAPNGEPVEVALTRELAFSSNVDRILSEVGSLLKEKNRSYGDSALNPVRVFSKSDRLEQLNVRIDDKISRIQRGHEYPGDDTIRDLIGYLTLILIARERLEQATD